MSLSCLQLAGRIYKGRECAGGGSIEERQWAERGEVGRGGWAVRSHRKDGRKEGVKVELAVCLSLSLPSLPTRSSPPVADRE